MMQLVTINEAYGIYHETQYNLKYDRYKYYLGNFTEVLSDHWRRGKQRRDAHETTEC